MAPAMQFNLPTGQWADLDGSVMRFVRRARDRDRRLVFEGLDGVPHDMSDTELLDLQHNRRRLRLLTAAEASDRLEEAGRPRVTFARNDPALSDRARLCLDYVRGWERAGCPPRTEAAIQDIVEEVFQARQDRNALPVERRAPSARQVLRWVASWVGSGGDIETLVPQVANKGNTTDRLSSRAREILERVVEDRYLVGTRPTAVSVYKHVIVAFEDHNAALPVAERIPTPSVKAVYRAIGQIDRYTLDCTRLGRRKADHNWRPVGSSPQTTMHNEVWEIDSTPMDLIVLDEATRLPIGRPYVTTAIDRHTRMVTGFHLGFDPPGTYSTNECLRAAILPKDELLANCPEVTGDWPCMGTPIDLVPDRGSEFRSRSFVEACLTLGIDLQYTPVLKAWYKGKIERFFRTLTTDVFQRVPGTTFSNFLKRNKEDIPETVAVATLGEVRAQVLRYIVEIYHRRRHRGLGVSPLEAWNESVRLHGMRPLPDPQRVMISLSQVAYRIPQRYGIEFEGLHYNSHAVAAYRIRNGAPKALRIAVDPRDLTSIQFMDPDTGEFIDVPIQDHMRPRVTGITLEKHKLARAMQRNSPETLAGETGLVRAYSLIDDAMRNLGAANGLANRRRAAGYWETLQRAKPPEDPVAFDTVASARGVTDGLFGNRPADPDEETAAVVKDEAAVVEQPAVEPLVAPKRRRRKTDEPDATPTDAPPRAETTGKLEDPDSLDDYARSLGMGVRKNGKTDQ